MAPYHLDSQESPSQPTQLSWLTFDSLTALKDFCAFVPLRLSQHERSLLAVLESVLHVSEYTDQVDVSMSRYHNIPGSVVRDGHHKIRKVLDGILEACHLATGLGVCAALDKVPAFSEESLGIRMTADEDSASNIKFTAHGELSQNAHFFQKLFEIGRRNKILNPCKMRDTYGKLMYLLQDAQSRSVTDQLGFSLVVDLEMVQPFLEKRGAESIFDDERLLGATAFIPTRDKFGKKLTKASVEDMFKRKRQMMNEIIQDHSEAPSEDLNHSTVKRKISRNHLQRCIESIADAISFVQSNVIIVERMLSLLEENFDPQVPVKPFSLELRGLSGAFRSMDRFSYGFGAFGSYGSSSSGPTLSHSHSTQYTFVWQSLTLWMKVQINMYRLWYSADEDLLSTTESYELLNTGQGLNRVQSCPRVAKIMRSLLVATQKSAGTPWVGLTVIHLGDRDVPNALIFIDKYTQIPHILKPIADFVDGIDEMCNTNNAIAAYVKREFGSQDNLMMLILTDYFKHGFDGSGDDGGSCIDGRLTSSWNWTSLIAKKKFYHCMMLSGFLGFDGNFK